MYIYFYLFFIFFNFTCFSSFPFSSSRLRTRSMYAARRSFRCPSCFFSSVLDILVGERGEVSRSFLNVDPEEGSLAEDLLLRDAIFPGVS